MSDKHQKLKKEKREANTRMRARKKAMVEGLEITEDITIRTNFRVGTKTIDTTGWPTVKIEALERTRENKRQAGQRYRNRLKAEQAGKEIPEGSEIRINLRDSK